MRHLDRVTLHIGGEGSGHLQPTGSAADDAKALELLVDGAQCLDLSVHILGYSLLPLARVGSLLTTLVLGGEGITSVPGELVKLTNLRVLQLAKCTSLKALPDLTPLSGLELIYLPDPLVKQGFPCRTMSYLHTKETLTLLRRRFHFGGSRLAVYTLMCIKKYTSVLKMLNQDVVMMIARMLHQSRAEPVWSRVDKLIYDVERFHCPWPPRFVSPYGPSVFSCDCGFQFVEDPQGVDPYDDEAVWAIYARRKAHFLKVYQDSGNWRENWRAISYPLNKAVQKVMLRPAYKNVFERSRVMVDDVISYLNHRTGNRIILTGGAAHIHTSSGNKDADRGFLFEDDIKGDVSMCIDNYLELRNAGAAEPRSGNHFNGLFSHRLKVEKNLRK
jgi:hypothetical protein